MTVPSVTLKVCRSLNVNFQVNGTQKYVCSTAFSISSKCNRFVVVNFCFRAVLALFDEPILFLFDGHRIFDEFCPFKPILFFVDIYFHNTVIDSFWRSITCTCSWRKSIQHTVNLCSLGITVEYNYFPVQTWILKRIQHNRIRYCFFIVPIYRQIRLVSGYLISIDPKDWA